MAKEDKQTVFECCACDPNHPCVAIRRAILDNKEPTECPFNDTADWGEVL